MISNSVDGSTVSGASQLFDLLSIVSNSQVYESRIKELQTATEENRKYVEAVAPASEILKLRDEARVDRQIAADAANEAKLTAQESKATAKKQAEGIVAAAQQKADEIIKQAEALAAKAAEMMSQAESSRVSIEQANQKLSATTNAVELREAKAVNLAQEAAAAKAEAEDLKAVILAKHRAFIESL